MAGFGTNPMQYPNYGNPYANMYGSQPYQTAPTMPQYQQPQPMQMQRMNGRLVNSPEEITVQDVPTDGTIGWFPLGDGSAVIAKRWTADGKIESMAYVPQQPAERPKDPMQVLNEKVDAILAALAPTEGDTSNDEQPARLRTENVTEQPTNRRKSQRTANA